MQKLKKRHKSAWQGWWQQKRENNQSLISYVKMNNSKEVSNLLDISSKDLRPEINIRDECGMAPV
jgi:protein-serine/threonine kinase